MSALTSARYIVTIQPGIQMALSKGQIRSFVSSTFAIGIICELPILIPNVRGLLPGMSGARRGMASAHRQFGFWGTRRYELRLLDVTNLHGLRSTIARELELCLHTQGPNEIIDDILTIR